METISTKSNVASRKRIALIMCRPTREQPIMESFQKDIENRYPNSEVEIFDQTHEWGSGRLELLRFAPDIVVTYPFTCVGRAPFYYFLKFTLNCRIVVYRTEGYIIWPIDRVTHSEKLRWTTGYDCYDEFLVDCEIFWGPLMATLVGAELVKQGKLNNDADRILYTGSPSVQHNLASIGKCHPGTIHSLPFMSSQEYRTRQKTVLVLTGFQYASYPVEDFYRAGDFVNPDSVDPKDTLRDVQRYRHKEIQRRDDWVQMLERVLTEYPDLDIWIKLHPIEIHQLQNGQENFYDKLRCYPNAKLICEPIAIQDLLPHVSLMLHYGSTCAAEASIAGVPAYFVQNDAANSIRTRFCDQDDLSQCSMGTVKIEDVVSLLNKHHKSPIEFKAPSALSNDLFEQFNLVANQPYLATEETSDGIFKVDSLPYLDFANESNFFKNVILKSDYCEPFRNLLFARAKELAEEDETKLAFTWVNRCVKWTEFIGVTPVQILLFRAQLALTLGIINFARSDLDAVLAYDQIDEELRDSIKRIKLRYCSGARVEGTG